ncbi:MAG TPA: hypothetical protein VHE35_24915 [Kofleriaceae bacterium]|nr:hypothetical protein [Kofleriaceae bacterium]
MKRTSPWIGSILLVGTCVLGAAGCGKKGSKEPDKGKTAAPSAAVKAPAATPPAASAKKLPNLPLQADVAESWKIEADPVAPEGGARLSTATGEVSIMKDGVGGVAKTTLDDEKKQLSADPASPPQDVDEQQLADGWTLSFKTAGVLPYHATVYRNIGTGSYRCVITTEEAAQMADGIAVCKSLRP